MRKWICALLLAAAAVALVWAQSSSGIDGASQKKIAVLDDCLPGDPGYAPTGGCLLTPKEGNVALLEFGQLRSSPLSAAVVGHPSWRNSPSYVTVETGQTVRVTNEGGRGHTFTEVANFGGGFVPQLNQGLIVANECLAAAALPPGQTVELKGLAPGLHKYQCCIHPWMRAAIRVAPKK